MNEQKFHFHEGALIGNRYRVHRRAAGGLGQVYLCLDEKEQIGLVLKTAIEFNSVSRHRLEAEVSAWVAVGNHPNIVRCIALRIIDRIPFLVLEWVATDDEASVNLSTWLHNQISNQFETSLRFTIDIIRGLRHANQMVPGLVHRDLKPANILVDHKGRAKITDFGLAMITTELINDQPTQLEGTYAYMAPEQWLLSDQLDFRTDIYAVGSILYTLLTKSPPYLNLARTAPELREMHLSAPCPLLPAHYPTDLQRVLNRCLAKKPQNRYQNFDQLIDDLAIIYAKVTGAPPLEVDKSNSGTVDYYHRGLTYMNLKKYNLALENFDRYLRLKPDDADAYTGRASNYDRMGKRVLAMEDHNKAIQHAPDNERVYNNRGYSFSQQEQFTQAIQDYTQAIALKPDYALAYNNRGYAYLELHQYEAALQEFTIAIDLHPRYAEAYCNRGKCYEKLQRDGEAIQDFQQAINLAPNYEDAHDFLGTQYRRLGDHNQAARFFSRSIEIEPYFAQSYYNRGNSHRLLKDFKCAIADYSEAVRLNPTYARAYNNRGNCYRDIAQFEQSINDYAAAIAIDPNYTEPYYNRGTSYADLEKHDLALADFEKAIELGGGDFIAWAWYNKGVILSNKGQHNDAYICYVEASGLGFEEADKRMFELTQAGLMAFSQTTNITEMRSIINAIPFILDLMTDVQSHLAQRQDLTSEQILMFNQRLAWVDEITQCR